MKLSHLPLLCWILLLCSISQRSVAEPVPAQPELGNFIRVKELPQRLQLQTGVARYEKNGVTVDLIGAVHIADAAYYQKLNKMFRSYDSLLFEMVGGENIKKSKVSETQEVKIQEAKNQVERASHSKVGKKPKDPILRMLGGAYGMMCGALKLKGQHRMIDYTAENFVHADLTLPEFEALQAKRKESLMSFAFQNAKQSKKRQLKGEIKKIKEPDGRKILIGLLRRDADMLKREVMLSMGTADDQIAGFAGDTVIIGDRNAKCLQVLERQIKAGDKKIGIFYGAAHLPDMEKRLLKLGFQKKSQLWMVAWDVKK